MSTPEEDKDQVRIAPIVEYLVVGLGGGVGATARWGVGMAATLRPYGLPVSTLLVNLVGCALIGLAAATIGRRSRDTTGWRFGVTGVLGGFTTFSALMVETDVLIEEGRWLVALAYLGVTLTGGRVATNLFVRRAGGFGDGGGRTIAGGSS